MGIVFGEDDPPLEKQQAPIFQLFFYFGECVQGEFQVFAGMRGGDLRADARGAVRHDRIEKANHVDALLQHARGELL